MATSFLQLPGEVCVLATAGAGVRRPVHRLQHPHEVGTGYFDQVAQMISSCAASTLALTESTQTQQF